MSKQSLTTDRANHRVTALSIISLSSFVSAFMGSAFSVAAPVMTDPLSSQYVPGLDEAGMSWVIAVYILATAMLQIPFGKIADNYGRKRLYLIGMIIFTVTAFILGFMNNETTLVIFRFIQGFGAALIFATGTAILTSIYPQEERGKAFGINTGSTYIGLTAGPSLGGIIVEFLGWRSIFFSVVPFGILICFLITFLLKGEWKNEKKEKIDYIGAIIYMTTLFLLLYGFKSIETNYGYYFIGSSIVFLFVFFYWENKVAFPLLELTLFKKNKFFRYANLTAFLFYSATFSTALLLTYYLQDILYLSVSITGLILLAMPFTQALLSPIGGRLSDKIEHRTITTIGVATGLIGLSILAFINQKSSLILVIFGLLLGGIGFGLFSSPNVNSIMSSVNKKMYGVASALVGTMRTVGQSISLGITTLLFSLFLGSPPTSALFSFKRDNLIPILPSHLSLSQHNLLLLSSIKIAFFVSLGLCVFALISSYSRGKINFKKNNNLE